jgi:hypothetical protein
MVWIILPIMLVYRLVPSMMEIAALLMFLLFIASLALFWRLNNAVLAQGAVAPTLAVAAMVLMSIVIDYWLRLALAIP